MKDSEILSLMVGIRDYRLGAFRNHCGSNHRIKTIATAIASGLVAIFHFKS